MKIRLHAIEPASRANGPGLRAVVWLQGCTLGCPGCFNPATHDPQGGFDHDTEQLANELLSQQDGIEGVSFSGGEPFQQPDALLDLLGRLSATKLSRLVFTGYAIDEIRGFRLGPAILEHVDVVIAGRYVASQRTAHGLLGSSNQQIHLLSERYGIAELEATPINELILRRDGSITSTGIRPWRRISQRELLQIPSAQNLSSPATERNKQ